MDYSQELKMYKVFNRTGMTVVMRPEIRPNISFLVKSSLKSFPILREEPNDVALLLESKNIFNTTWIVEVGSSRMFSMAESRMGEQDPATGSRKSHYMEQKTDFPNGFSDYSSAFKQLDRETFTNLYKPLREININGSGEKCYMLVDKKMEVTMVDSKKESHSQGDSKLHMLVEVSNSKSPGTKNIYFNSLIQVKSELNFDLKITLECESAEQQLMEMPPDSMRYVPLRYCFSDTVMTLSADSDRLATGMDEAIGDNEIRFSSFLNDKDYTSTSNFYLNNSAQGWDKIREKDGMLVLTHSEMKGNNNSEKHKVQIAVSVYKKKISVANRGNQWEPVHIYLITLRPMVIIKNLTPRPVELSIAREEERIYMLQPNGRYVSREARLIDEKTSMKVARADGRSSSSRRTSSSAPSATPSATRTRKSRSRQSV